MTSLSSSTGVRDVPFVAPAPALWRERFANVCSECFVSSRVCEHHPELPLPLLILGHNPSTTAWSTGIGYSHGSNRMWGLLHESGLVPQDKWDRSMQNDMVAALGIGWTDLGTEPGNDAASYSRHQLRAWRTDLYARLSGHVLRVGDTLESLWHYSSIGAPSPSAAAPPWLKGMSKADASRALSKAARVAGLPSFSSLGDCRRKDVCAPQIVAISGKHQWCELFDPPLSTCSYGTQPLRPPGWPLPLSTAVYVLPSSSGRAAMTNDARLAPYRELAALVAALRDV